MDEYKEIVKAVKKYNHCIVLKNNIEGISCLVFLMYAPLERVYKLFIKDKNIFHILYQKLSNNEEEICQALSTIPDMKYNRMFNILETEEREDIYEYSPYCEDKLNTMLTKEESIYQPCSVCYEITCTVIKCAHTICVECISKMEYSNCPMCRRIMEVNIYARRIF